MQKSHLDPLRLLNEWATNRCVFTDRQWGGVRCLYKDLCRWSAAHETTPVFEDEFTEWLISGGLIVDSYGLVYGLVLEEDGVRVQ
jgi:hypothetical protein